MEESTVQAKKKNIPEVQVISDPEVIKILLNPTRREILRVLRKGYYRDGSSKISYDMSVGEIAEILETTPQRLYHHIDKLIEAGLVEKSREVKKVRSVITFYRRTARNFIIAYEADETGQMYEEQGKNLAKTLDETFDLSLSDTEKEKVANLLTKISRNSSFYFSQLAEKLSPNYQGKDVHWAMDIVRRAFQIDDPTYIKCMKDLKQLLETKIDVVQKAKE
ncbi:MAG: ArsR family transcriptional regulator [Methanobacteriota archaeon]|nr:MAG: ArsR family transcriptional regulator [Euryarchaeota archaeon]